MAVVATAQQNSPANVGGRAMNNNVNEEFKGNAMKRVATRPRLFVGGLLRSIPESAVRKYFGNFGDLVSLDLKKETKHEGKAFAFLAFANDRSEKAVLNQAEHYIEGCRVEVKEAHTGSKMPAREEGASAKLFVGGLPKSATVAEVRRVFEPFGVIAAFEMQTAPNGQNKGYCFVRYRDAEITARVLSSHNKLSVNGTWVEVKRYNASTGGAGAGRLLSANSNPNLSSPPVLISSSNNTNNNSHSNNPGNYGHSASGSPINHGRARSQTHSGNMALSHHHAHPHPHVPHPAHLMHLHAPPSLAPGAPGMPDLMRSTSCPAASTIQSGNLSQSQLERLNSLNPNPHHPRGSIANSRDAAASAANNPGGMSPIRAHAQQQHSRIGGFEVIDNHVQVPVHVEDLGAVLAAIDASTRQRALKAAISRDTLATSPSLDNNLPQNSIAQMVAEARGRDSNSLRYTPY